MRLHYCVKHKREYYGDYGCVECEIAKAKRKKRDASTVNATCDKHNYSKVLI